MVLLLINRFATVSTAVHKDSQETLLQRSGQKFWDLR